MKQIINGKEFDITASADLRGADLSDADLRGADLSDADLSDANLSFASLRGADLSDADLSDANLRRANLSNANLSFANLSDVTGLLDPSEYIQANFELTSNGFIAYKTFNAHYPPNDNWIIKAESYISEIVNSNRTNDCGCGVNVGTLEWVKANTKGDIWQVEVSGFDMMGVVVPYNTDGKIRVGRCKLIQEVDRS